MMKEVEPPSYDDTLAVPVYPLPASATNPAFLPDEDQNVPTAPVLNTRRLTTAQQIASPSFAPLSLDEIRRSCHFYATERCCYGSGFIENMNMVEVSDRIAYHYILESYGEKRETADQMKPYHGEAVDGPQCGPALRPWDVPVTSSRPFQDGRKVVVVPHTSYLKECVECEAKGTEKCIWCFGKGGKGCFLCLSDKSARPCPSCRISGNRCVFCNGRGTLNCKNCEGSGKLLCYKILLVTWTNHKEHFVTDTLSLPPEKIEAGAKGRQLVLEEADELTPIWNVPNASVIAASTGLIEKHRSGFGNERIIKQRHVVEAVPFTQVKYCWRGEVGHFYVYGLQKKAYFEEYPQQCCCCCNVL